MRRRNDLTLFLAFDVRTRDLIAEQDELPDRLFADMVDRRVDADYFQLLTDYEPQEMTLGMWQRLEDKN